MSHILRRTRVSRPIPWWTMVMRSALAALVIAAPPAVAQSAHDPVAFDVARVSRDIETLSSDAFEGRAPATPGETKATRYIAAQMRAAGLKPAGDGGGWFQSVPLLKADIVGQPRLAVTEAGRTT